MCRWAPDSVSRLGLREVDKGSFTGINLPVYHEAERMGGENRQAEASFRFLSALEGRVAAVMHQTLNCSVSVLPYSYSRNARDQGEELEMLQI